MTKNPESAAMHPTIFVIFGITGDLSSRKLLPALLALYAKKLLPEKFAIVGFSRRALDRDEFRDLVRGKLGVRPGQFKEEDIKHFFDHISYARGQFDDPEAYRNLSQRLKAVDDRWGQCSNKLYHLSVPPHLYEGILKNLAGSDLTRPCDDGMGWTRVLIEKPFGRDIETASSLDKLLGKLFQEEQIFRIDHYLAKETLQNILAFRFNNSIFEPVWSREHVSMVHIKLLERGGVEGRGALYEQIGALKDVGQNHILQMLALVAMERPRSFSPADIRGERARVLSKLRPFPSRHPERFALRGQYAGYMKDAGVSGGSATETYFRLEAQIDLPRWKGVPFHLESGKAMSESKTEIDIYFKAPETLRRGRNIFGRERASPADETAIERQNILTFRIQPEEGIKVRFFAKTPGHEWHVEPRTLKFHYADTTAEHWRNLPNDYERLIRDAFIGDQTLFASTDEIMASWRFVASVEQSWKKLPLTKYEKGSREL